MPRFPGHECFAPPEMCHRFRHPSLGVTGRAAHPPGTTREEQCARRSRIVGAGPAGLMLSHLLHRAGISSVIVEARSRAYCEARIRAGLIEQWAADMLVETGVGARMQRESMVHDGIHHGVRRRAASHRLPQAGRQARHDLRPAGGGEGPDRAAARRRRADPVRSLRRQRRTASTAEARASRSRTTGRAQEIECDFIGGCDGFHGVCRPSIPAGVLTDLRPRISVRLARHPGAGAAGRRRADLRLPPARLRAVLDALADARALLPAMRAGREPRRLAGREDLGRAGDAARRHAAARRAGRWSRRSSRRCARSWPSRCGTAGCSWRATARTSCRRPAPRA